MHAPLIFPFSKLQKPTWSSSHRILPPGGSGHSQMFSASAYVLTHNAITKPVAAHNNLFNTQHIFPPFFMSNSVFWKRLRAVNTKPEVFQ